MKTHDPLGAVLATSHRRVVRVDLYGPSGLLEQGVPITDGDLVARANSMDRWSARLTLPGDQWVPVLPTDALSGFAGTYLVVHVGAEVDTVEQLVPVCRVIPVNTRTR